MRNFAGRVVLLAAAAVFVPACGDRSGSRGGGANVIVGGNQPPVVSLLSPVSNASFSAGATILLEAQASDPDGSVVRVDFFDGATLVTSMTRGPFQFDWTTAVAGAHSLTAVATDDSGAETTSLPVLIVVVGPGGGGSPPSSPPQGMLNGVFFADANRGWVVGDGIWATTDGGATWSRQAFGVAALQRVQFVDPMRGWAVGGPGIILRTLNGGSTWTAQDSGTTLFLWGLSFVDAQTGWVVGADGTILKTTTGGASWTAQTSGSSGPLTAVAFASASTGWIGGSGEILTTVNGGATWMRQTASFTGPSGIPHNAVFYDARFAGTPRGVFAGGTADGDVLFTTTDGGATFMKSTLHPPPFLFNGVAFGDVTHWWAVGTQGSVAASLDGGASWFAQATPTTQTLHGVWFVTATAGWAVGAQGTVLRTTDGGLTWVTLTTGS